MICLYACRNLLVLNFSKHLRNYKEFSKWPGFFFQVLLSTIFYKKSATFNETLLTWIFWTCNILSRKIWFLFIDKSQVQRSEDVITCLFFPVKKQKFSGSQAHNWNPPLPFQGLSFSNCLECVCVCVCFVYLPCLYQH